MESKMKVICENKDTIIVQIDSFLYYFSKDENGKVTLYLVELKEMEKVEIPFTGTPILEKPITQPHYPYNLGIFAACSNKDISPGILIVSTEEGGIIND